MVKILQVPPGMLVSTHILVMNNQEEMILNALVMLSYISLKGRSHGKVFQEDLKLRNMPTSRKRKRKPRLKNYAKTNLKNSKNLCTTVEVWLSHRIQTMVISSIYSKDA